MNFYLTQLTQLISQLFFWQLLILLLWIASIIWTNRIYIASLLLFTMIFVIIASSLKSVIMVNAKLHLLPSIDAPSTLIDEWVEILKENNGWYNVKTKHGYGWIQKNNIR